MTTRNNTKAGTASNTTQRPRRTKPNQILAADLFCGAGGGSNGFIDACEELGLDFDLVAVNHWPVAIATHQTNHPNVRHLCENLECVWPRDVVPKAKLHFALFAPECTSHSRARGGRPKNDQSRATAYHVPRWAEELDIENILVENVKEFIDWGPLYPADHPNENLRGKPIPEKKGLFFREWCSMLRKRGYKIEYRILNAAWFGGATSRERFFLQAKKHGKITWPEATHEAGDNLFGKPKYRGAKEIIDWSLKGNSIYNRKKPLAENTMRRIYAGLEKFSGLPFIVPQFTSQGPRSIERPLGTLTTQSRGVGLCEPFLVVLRRCADGRSLSEPAPTVCANGGHLALAQPFVVPVTHGGGENRVNDVEKPLPTVTGAKCGELALIDPYLIAMEHTTAESGDHRRVRELDKPLPTVTGWAGFGLTEPTIVPLDNVSEENRSEIPLGTPFLTKYHGSHRGRSDGDNRVHSIEEPIKTLDTQPRFGVAESFVVPVTHSKSGDVVHSVEDPLKTITTAKGGEFAIAQPVLVQRDQEQEIDLEASWLVSFKGNDDAKSIEAPLGTLTTHERFGKCDAFVIGQQSCAAPRSVEEPLPTVSTAGAISFVEPVFRKKRKVQWMSFEEWYSRTKDVGGTREEYDEWERSVLVGEEEEYVDEEVSPFILPPEGIHRGNSPRSLEDPLQTITQRGGGNLVAPFIVPYYGNSSATSIDDPLDTVTTKHRFALVQPEFLEAAGLTMDDVVGILDIKFRMLQTHELAAAMGFPEDYVFTGNKEQQVKQIGNAIEYNVIKALCHEMLKPYAAKPKLQSGDLPSAVELLAA